MSRHSRYYRHNRARCATHACAGSWFDQRAESVRQLAVRVSRAPVVRYHAERLARKYPGSTRAGLALLRAAIRVAGSEPTARVLRALEIAGLIPFRLAKHIWESGRE